MRITCYGGVGQIGGNKILVEDGAASFFFDFGTPFGDRGRFFEEYLNPRAGAGLLDIIEMGLVPPLGNVYRPDFVPPGRFWERIQRSPHLKAPYRELDRVDGVLVSHAHVDHNGYLSFLRADIPIYSSAMTGFVAKAMQDSGQSDFERESVYATPREEKDGVLQTANYRGNPARQRPYHFYDFERLTEEARRFWGETPWSRDLAAVPAEQAGRIGELALRSFPVDHSIYGSAAFSVETSAGWVVYTGDVRFQGGTAAATRRFIEEVAKLRPRVLLCEGTRLTPNAKTEEPTSEQIVQKKALEAIRSTSGLVVADFGPRNIERLRTFLEVAKETGRNLVVLDKDAYLLHAMHLVDPNVPTIESEPNLLIYQNLRSMLAKWQQELREQQASRFVGANQVRANLGDFILCFSFFDVKNLIDIDPPDGLYLYSSSEVYDEEGAMDMVRLRNWLAHFNLSPLGVPELTNGEWKTPTAEEGYHASGHATGEEILSMVREISPQTVVPIHTQHPELFVERLAGSSIEVRVPEYGRELSFQ